MEFFPVFDLCRCGMIILLNEGLCWLWNNKLIFSDITAVGIFNYTNRHVLWCHQERRSYQIQYPSQNGKLSEKKNRQSIFKRQYLKNLSEVIWSKSCNISDVQDIINNNELIWNWLFWLNRYKDIIKFTYKKIRYTNRSKTGTGYLDKSTGKWTEPSIFRKHSLYHFH